MTLWIILTVMTSASAVLVSALFLKRQVACVGMAALIVVGAVGLYAIIASRDMPLTATTGWASRPRGSSATDQLAETTNSQAAAGRPQRQSQFRLASVDETIDGLAEWLSRNPKDTEAWHMLGRTYFSAGRFAEAAAAYADAIKSSPDRVDLRSAHGEALVRSAGGVVTEEAKADFQKALPWDPRSRYFMGLMKEQAGDKASALDDWISLLNESRSEEPWYAELMQHASKLGNDIGVDVSARLRSPGLIGSRTTLGFFARQREGEREAADKDQSIPDGLRGAEQNNPGRNGAATGASP
jgi:cytochrome c-type biogenesis protein CcmH